MPPHLYLAAAGALALLCACASPAATHAHAGEPASVPERVPAEPPAPCALDGAGVFYVASEDPARPRVRYADGQVGAADHCAIRTANKLSRRIPPVYVNGRPIGFC